MLEISLPEGQVRRLISGGISRTPDWAPSGAWNVLVAGRAMDLLLAQALRETGPGKSNALRPGLPRRLWRTPAGDWIGYPAADGIDSISPDGKSTRNLTSRKFLAYGFSKDGSQFYGVFQNTTGNGAQWQLYR